MSQNNVLALIHKGARESNCNVKDYNEIVSPTNKKLVLNYGLNMIEMKFDSVEEAKKRALVLAVVTYNFRH